MCYNKEIRFSLTPPLFHRALLRRSILIMMVRAYSLGQDGELVSSLGIILLLLLLTFSNPSSLIIPLTPHLHPIASRTSKSIKAEGTNEWLMNLLTFHRARMKPRSQMTGECNIVIYSLLNCFNTIFSLPPIKRHFDGSLSSKE